MDRSGRQAVRARARLAVVVISLLTLLLGPATPGPALAKDSVKDFTAVIFLMTVTPPRRPFKVCVGQTQEVRVHVSRALAGSLAERLFAKFHEVGGVEVTGKAAKPAIASVTAVGGRTGVRPILSGDPYADMGVRFDLKGLKPGTTSIDFTADVQEYWVGSGSVETTGRKPFKTRESIEITVVPCDYEVSTVSTWSGDGYVVTASVEDARVQGTEDGTLHGTGTVAWVAKATAKGCRTGDRFEPSSVDITGTVDEDGNVQLSLDYAAATDHAFIDCRLYGLGEQRKWTVENEPSTIALTLAPDAVSGSTEQVLDGEQSDASGWAVLTLERVDGEGAAGSAPDGPAVRAQALLAAASPSPASPSPSADPSPTPSPSGIPSQLELGSGTVLLDAGHTGLADLPGYTATLHSSFDGTVDGAPAAGEATAEMTVNAATGDRLLVVRSVAHPEDATVRAEVDGLAYVQRAGSACTVRPIDPAEDLASTFEPADQLFPLLGADAGAATTVDGRPAHEATFDARALGLANIATAGGSATIADDTGVVLAYDVTLTAGPELLGDGVEGTRTLAYRLAVADEAPSVAIPDGCPSPLAVPVAGDARQLLRLPAIVRYTSPSSVAKLARFYDTRLSKGGWKRLIAPDVGKGRALLGYRRNGRQLTIILRKEDGGISVRIAGS